MKTRVAYRQPGGTTYYSAYTAVQNFTKDTVGIAKVFTNTFTPNTSKAIEVKVEFAVTTSNGAWSTTVWGGAMWPGDHYLRFDQYRYDVSGGSTLATGTVNWTAIGE